MRKLISVFFIIFFSGFIGFAENITKITNKAFTYKEQITYRIKYNLYFNINVGEVNFKIAEEPKVIGNHKCMHIKAVGKTYSFYDPFYKVRDTYESYVDEKTLLPIVFIRDVQEGEYKFNEHVIFNHNTNMAKSEKRVQKIPPKTQDVLSSIYLARNFDYNKAKVGDPFYLTTFVDDTTYNLGVKYLGKETISTSFGKFRCLKLQPILIVGHMFKSEDQMMMWVTDDDNRIPIRIESGISVGKIRADLSDYKNLRNSFSSKINKK